MSNPRKSDTTITILLSTAGLASLAVAVIILLKGFGVISTVPSFVIWALVLLILGFGILAGLRTLGD
ncbi:MAG: hypothetical protein WBA13_04765 [Microcoleaceae cyanobacterium]